MPADKLTIGVFDSGFGGLTVLRELLPLIPGAHYIYLGDTARLPYGSKSHETIARYAVSSARYLHEQGADLLIIACNTATALAFDDIRRAMPIPVIGVIQPGAGAALAAQLSASKSNTDASFRPEAALLAAGVEKPASLPQRSEPPQNHVLVLATQATIQSHAYAQALKALGLKATEKACPLLVPLVEEGWTNHPVTDEVIKIYLTEALTEAPNAQTLLLGCTHYPLIEPAIARVLGKLGHPLTIIDSAHATAKAVVTYLGQHQKELPFRNEAASSAVHNSVISTGGGASAAGAEKPASLPLDSNPTCTFYATDSIEKFQRLGSNFLGRPLAKVHLLDLGG